MNAAILACYRESPLYQDEEVGLEQWSNIGGLYRLEVQAITPGNEASYGMQWLYATLSGDPTLSGIAVGGVYRNLAPTLVATPYVIIGFQSGTETLTMTAVRLFTQPLYQVKAVGPSQITSQIVAAAAAIDALLGRTPNIGYI